MLTTTTVEELTAAHIHDVIHARTYGILIKGFASPIPWPWHSTA